jgi:hypothetical protein
MTAADKDLLNAFIFLYCSTDLMPQCEKCDYNLMTLKGNKACCHPAHPFAESNLQSSESIQAASA